MGNVEVESEEGEGERKEGKEEERGGQAGCGKAEDGWGGRVEGFRYGSEEGEEERAVRKEKDVGVETEEDDKEDDVVTTALESIGET